MTNSAVLCGGATTSTRRRQQREKRRTRALVVLRVFRAPESSSPRADFFLPSDHKGFSRPSPYSFAIRSSRWRLLGGSSAAARPNSPLQVERSRRSTSNSEGGFSEERSRVVHEQRPPGSGKAASRTLDRSISPHSTRTSRHNYRDTLIPQQRYTVAFMMKILKEISSVYKTHLSA